ncbi:hypothetical protein FB45DRAFT_1058239 [Roridomyces roridus]|uniref:Uncharacterized protein n=1 Tax=Roridomyces roridus TaxID=1738132 RepID=A0AAD7BTF2_9AGAR|nr:hypothetical protein FB45DRAFT_1058239 [Roridomyces roridus]
MSPVLTQASTSPSYHHLVHAAVTGCHTAHIRPGEPQTTFLNATLTLRTSSQISRSLPCPCPPAPSLRPQPLIAARLKPTTCRPQAVCLSHPSTSLRPQTLVRSPSCFP